MSTPPIYVNRRQFLYILPAGSAIAGSSLSGCGGFDFSDKNAPNFDCERTADLLELSLCRQYKIRASAPQYITLGMLIGAALGAASAPLLKVNPLAGVVIGALAGGTVTAVERYLDISSNWRIAIRGLR